MTPDFNRICRLCLREDYSLTNIFDEAKGGRHIIPLPQQMMSIASLKVSSCDGLPNKICLHCLDQVHRSFEFKTQCERSEATLRRFMGHHLQQLGNPPAISSVPSSELSHPQVSSNHHFGDPKNMEETRKDGPAPPTNYSPVSVRGVPSPHESVHGNSSEELKGLHHPGWPEDSHKDALKSIPTSHDGPAPIPPKWDFDERRVTTVHEFISNLHQFTPGIQNGERHTHFPPGSSEDSNSSLHPTHSVFNNLKPIGLLKQSDTFAGPVFVPTKRAQGSVKSVYYCDLCSKMYSSAGALWNHKLIHTGTKPHTCSVCNKQFYQLANLKYHEKTHGEKQWYTCQTCRKSLKTELGLKLHSLQHSGDKPYLCPYCNKPFTTLGVLEAHVRIHTGEKPYECSYCYKTFAQQGTLTCHIRRHTGEKPFACKFCHKSFTQRANLNEHMKRYHVDLLEDKDIHQGQHLLQHSPTPLQHPPTSLHQPPTPLHQPPTSLHQPPTPLQQPPTPLPQPLTPLQQPPTPLQQPPTPLQQPPTPLQQPLTPLQQSPTPISLQQPPTPQQQDIQQDIQPRQQVVVIQTPQGSSINYFTQFRTERQPCLTIFGQFLFLLRYEAPLLCSQEKLHAEARKGRQGSKLRDVIYGRSLNDMRLVMNIILNHRQYKRMESNLK